MTVEQMDGVTRAEYERELDLALAGSFPASDPLPWTLGFASEPVTMPAAPRAPGGAVVVEPQAQRPIP